MRVRRRDKVHIICQKPLAPAIETSRRIVDNAAKAGVRFMVHENFRWQPWYRKIQQLRDSGQLGQFTHLYFRLRTGDGRGERATSIASPSSALSPAGSYYETGVHFIDTFRFLLGKAPRRFTRISGA